jgi:hypothetical protein
MEIETGQLQSRAKLTDKFNVLKQALGFCSPASFFQFCLFSVSPRLRGKAVDFLGGRAARSPGLEANSLPDCFGKVLEHLLVTLKNGPDLGEFGLDTSKAFIGSGR